MPFEYTSLAQVRVEIACLKIAAAEDAMHIAYAVRHRSSAESAVSNDLAHDYASRRPEIFPVSVNGSNSKSPE
jgi:hypothetical protein